MDFLELQCFNTIVPVVILFLNSCTIMLCVVLCSVYYLHTVENSWLLTIHRPPVINRVV